MSTCKYTRVETEICMSLSTPEWRDLGSAVEKNLETCGLPLTAPVAEVDHDNAPVEEKTKASQHLEHVGASKEHEAPT